MKSFFRYALVALALCFVSLPANAATCFWVGGTASYDSVNTTSWASGTGGTPGTCAATGGIPKNAGDLATFDGNSGGGTVTVCGALTTTCPSGTGSLSIATITSSAFTGTLDFSAINPNVTLTTSWTDAGSGTHTVNMGAGNWTFVGGSGATVINFTGASMTLAANSSTITVTNNTSGSTTLALNGKTFNIVTLGPFSNAAAGPIFTTGANTFATLNLTTPVSWRPTGNVIQTITNAVNWVGTASQPIGIVGSEGGGNPATLHMSAASGTAQWVVFNRITVNTNTITDNPGLDLGGNSGITFTAPTTGGGAHIIGG